MSDKIKKLSDAIRLGATFRPQWRGTFFESGKTCAMGAAFEAVGCDVEKEGFPWPQFQKAAQRWPELKHYVQCPHCGETHDSSTTKGSVFATIVALNNSHEWSRERIADWLSSIGL